jgi:hypothetical protein
VALYALDKPALAAGWPDVARHLAALAEEEDGRARWRSRPEHLLLARNADPYPIYVLGPSHGAAGILLVLAELAARGVERERCLRLARGAAAWLLAQRRPAAPHGSFPMHEGHTQPKAIGWCLGDLGIAHALWLAGRLVGEPTWEAAAVHIALDVAALDPGATRVDDACVCHGAGSTGLLFLRLHARTGEPRFAAAARRWYQRALELRDPGAPWGGFFYWDGRGEGVAKQRDGSFLLGGVGGALCLLAAVRDVAPGWDRVLAASSPRAEP